jgi:hypothetical protein
MTSPEEAVDRARRGATEARAAGRYPQAGPGPLDETLPTDVPDVATIAEWATIEVRPDVLYSTRRLGGAVTMLKRLLIRALRQYEVELEARQSRFNVALLARVREVEERVERLERSPGA